MKSGFGFDPKVQGAKNKMNLQNGIYKMVAVQCLKAVITPEIGLRYFCDENHSILVNGLRSDNPLGWFSIYILLVDSYWPEKRHSYWPANNN